MKKLYSFLVLVLMVVASAIPISAYDFQVDGFYYNLLSTSENEVEVSKCIHNSREVVIPSHITVSSGTTYKVSAIGSSAFYRNSFKKITIPNTVSVIKEFAFQECSLTEITIGEGVTQIDQRAFAGCLDISTINCNAKTPPTLGTDVFEYQIYLRAKLNIPEGSEDAYKAADIWSEFFREQYQVDGICYAKISDTEVEVARNEESEYIGDIVIPSQITVDGVTYTVTSIRKYAFSGYMGLTSVVLPNTIETISDFAFSISMGLKSVFLPNTIETIGDYAFYFTDLTSVEIPDNVKTIGESAFQQCFHLTTVVLGKSVEELGDNAFKLSRITEIDLPATLKEIGSYAFYGCSNLNSITIPSSIQTINKGTFSNSNITSVIIGENVKKICEEAFSECALLDSITIKAVTPPTMESNAFSDETYAKAKLIVPEGRENAYKNAEGWSMFSFDEANVDTDIKYNVLTDSTVAVISNESGYKGDVVIPSETVIDGKTYTVTEIGTQAFAKSEITSVVIPNTVTKINFQAFYSSQSLTSVTIGESVATIINSAFSGCPALDSISCLALTPPMLQGNIFNINIYSNAKLIVPEGCEDAYKTAKGWYKFYSDGSFVDTDIKYTPLTDSTVVVIAKESGYDGKVVIPSETVIGGKTYKVTEIGKEAFAWSEITSVVIPNTVTKINDWAFYYCYRLTSVTIGESVDTIDVNAFNMCPLDSISCLGQTPPSLSQSAFETGVYSKAKLTVPEGCEEAYKKAKGWHKFYPDGTYAEFTYEIISETEVALTGISSRETTNIVIPTETTIEGKTYAVTEIAQEAFLAANLTSIVIPNTIKKIGTLAFCYNPSLKTITLGTNVATIEDNAFELCSALDSITCLAQTPPTLGTKIFETEIYSNAKLIVPEGCEEAYKTTKGWSMFYPDGYYFIYKTISETEVAVSSIASEPPTNLLIPSETIIDGKTYKVTEIGVWVFSNKRISSVVIPNTVTTIKEYAFYCCENLKTITIGESVDTIDFYAFGMCPLDSISCLRQIPPTLGRSVFDDEIYSKAKLTVPEGCEEAYKKAKDWSMFYPDGTYAEFKYETISETEVAVCGIESGAPAKLLIPSETIIDGKTYKVTEIGKEAFSWSKITSVVIPNTVTKINEMAFYYCNRLTSVTIGESVDTIDVNAFCMCPLDSILCLRQTPPSLSQGAFETDIYSKAKLTVPDGCEEAYKKAKGWYKFYPDGTYAEFKYETISETEVAVCGIESESPAKLLIPSETIIDGKTYKVTEIGAWAFSYKQISSVVIPNTVTTIKEDAFYGCNLKTITIGDSVSTIGSDAFQACYELDSITCLAQIPPTLGEVVFAEQNYSNAKLIVPEGCEDAYKTTKGWHHFYPDGYYFIYETISENEVALTGIGSRETTNIVIPTETAIEGKTYTVTEIGRDAFSWSDITSVVIANTVTTIKESAFYACRNLKTITLGTNVATIENNAFELCSALDSITCLAQTPPTLGTQIFETDIYSKAKLTVPEGCEEAYKTSKGWYKFYPDGGYVDTEIEYEIISESTVAVVRKESGYLGKVVIPSETVIEGKTYKVTEIGEEAFSRTDAITSVTIPNTVTCIGIRAFYSCNSLTSMTLPDSLETIANWAFESCHKLTSINLPNLVSTIGFRTFYDCTELTEVITPKSLKTIEEESFAKCNNLTKVVIGDSVENINRRAFAECNKLTTLTIGRSVKCIGDEVFADCGAIDTIVVLSQTPPELRYEVFASIVYASASLTVPEGSEDAYKNAEGWKNFYKEYHSDEGIWYDELTDTEVTVMAVSPGTSEVVIPSETTIDGVTYTVTTIGKAAFKNCSDIKSVEIPASVTEICETAFQGCSELTEVTIGEITTQGRKNIMRRAVRNTNVTIASYAFEYCKKLKTVVLGENVTYIGSNTFRECPELVSVTCYAQTPPTLSDGTFDEETYKKATLTVPEACKDAYKAAEYWKEFYTQHFSIDGIQYKTISETEVEIVSNSVIVEEVVIPSQITVEGVTYSVTSISKNAFSWMGNITKIVIPNSVTHIGEFAFSCCSQLSTIVIGSNVETIYYGAFLECYNLSMIEVHATTPPTTRDNVFSSEIYSTAMLSVPSGSEEAYRAAETWKEFNIVSEITGVEGVLVDDNIVGYFNLHGTMSDKPWEGVNIVVYKDGTRRKVVYKF